MFLPNLFHYRKIDGRIDMKNEKSKSKLHQQQKLKHQPNQYNSKQN
jgi:hypothetical protein